jgi:hypothetical protein
MGDLMLSGKVERHRFFPTFFPSIDQQRTAAAGAVDQDVNTAEPARTAD